MSVVLAAGTSAALAPAIIAAAAGIVSTALLVWVALRAQSAKQLLEDIRQVVEKELDDPGRRAIASDMVKRALREVVGTDRRGRRWYDNDE